MPYLATYAAKSNHDKATAIMLYFGSLKVVYMHICIYIMFCMVF